jgi:2,4-dichlorophenol 6-monooxygenase
MSDVQVPVLIVGGGGAGLTASMLLSVHGVDALLVSSLPTTSIMPKAHVVHQRTMEIFRELGVADAIYERGCPPEQMSHTAWYRDVAGDDPDAGRLIAKMECWGAGYTDPAWVAASPCRQTNLPQIRLEPLLRARAQELNPNGVRFHHELLALEQHPDGVTAVVRDRDAGTDYTVRADYVLGCDGGRTVGRLLGVEMQGVRDVMRSVSVHMTADLSAWMTDDDVLIRWIVHPSLGDRFSVLVPMGPDRWGPQSEEWVFHMNYPIDEESLYDSDEKVVAQMRSRMGVPDFTPEIHVITRWSMEGLLASSMKVGRVFLLGDAAHRHPPTGGLGLNSAVQDAYNLCWKLASVVHGRADASLLDTFEPERLPVDARNTQRSVENALNHGALIAAIGIDPDSTPEENMERSRMLWRDGPDGDAARDAAWPAIASQSMEFNEQNVEFGDSYSSAAIVPDGTPDPVPVDDIRVYEPSTRPGSPLPHAWVEHHGVRTALRDIAASDGFLLIAGEDGAEWCGAAREIARRLGVGLTAIRVGHLEGDYLDPRCAFIRQREFTRTGAILVRPDRVVAWRAHEGSEDPDGALSDAVSRVLGLLTRGS